MAFSSVPCSWKWIFMGSWNMVAGSQKEGLCTEASNGKATADSDCLSCQNYKVTMLFALITFSYGQAFRPC